MTNWMWVFKAVGLCSSPCYSDVSFKTKAFLTWHKIIIIIFFVKFSVDYQKKKKKAL